MFAQYTNIVSKHVCTIYKYSFKTNLHNIQIQFPNMFAQYTNIVSKHVCTIYKYSFQTCWHKVQLVSKHDCKLNKQFPNYKYGFQTINKSFQTCLHNMYKYSFQTYLHNMYKYSFQTYLHNMYKYSFQTCLACNPLLLKVRVIKRRK